MSQVGEVVAKSLSVSTVPVPSSQKSTRLPEAPFSTTEVVTAPAEMSNPSPMLLTDLLPVRVMLLPSTSKPSPKFDTDLFSVSVWPSCPR